MKSLILFALIILLSSPVFSQENSESSIELTGSLYADSRIILHTYTQKNQTPMLDELPGQKSPVLAGVLSAILPGAGQVYNEDWWIAGIFVAVEAALIVTAVTYDNKGDDQTAFFESYADDYMNPEHNWSVVRYAEWLVEYKYNNDQELLNKIVISNDLSRPPWERVNWTELNKAETGSHKLPPHGDQQYYELIGKYHQYSGGWNDYTGGANNSQISSNFIYYSQQRGIANDYYNTASTAIIGVYINHLLSAAEAVWGTARFNKNLAVNFRVQPYNFADGTHLVPTMFVKFSF
jgi:hypothetical protein